MKPTRLSVEDLRTKEPDRLSMFKLVSTVGEGSEHAGPRASNPSWYISNTLSDQFSNPPQAIPRVPTSVSSASVDSSAAVQLSQVTVDPLTSVKNNIEAFSLV